jgi:DNA-binding MarR family transcriptional regulator
MLAEIKPYKCFIVCSVASINIATNRSWRSGLTVNTFLTELNITHLQFVLLAGISWLTRNGDLLTQVQLAEFCKIDVMQISQVARKLEVKELIQRSAHPTDTRAKVMNLTASGAAILDRALPLVEGLDAEFFSQCDRSILRAELKKIAR